MANVNFTDDSTRSSSRTSSYFGYFSKEDKILKKLRSFLDDSIIPILTETNRVVPSLFLLNTIATIFFYCQIFLGNYFLLIPNNPAPRILNRLSKIFFLYSYDNKEGIERFIFIIINLFLIVLALTILIDYSITRKHRKVYMFLIRIVYGHISTIIFIPNIVMTFYSLKTYGFNPTISNAFVVVFDIIFLFFNFLLNYFIVFVLRQNPFVSKQIFHWWRPHKMYSFICLNGFLFALCPLSDFFKDWARLVPNFLGILLGIYLALQVNDLPYESIIVNAFHNSIPFLSITSSLLSIIFISLNWKITEIYFIIPACFFLISFIALIIFYKKKSKKIISILNTQEFEGKPLDDEESKDCFYMSLNLSLSNSFFYLQVGLRYNCPLFLDWSLSNFLYEKFKGSRELLTFITWQAAFFPSASNQFSHFINSGLKMVNPPYIIRAFFYQLHRVHVFRQGATSQESENDLMIIRKKTKACTNMISDFWHSVSENKNRPSLLTIHKIYKKISETEALWSEMLDKYPNNPVFVREYSVFLMDAKSCYHDSILWHQKSIFLENGQKLQNDQMFRCFLKMYPHYLKKEIVDTRGNFRRNKTKQKVTFSDINGNQSSTENSSDTIDYVEGSTFLPLLHLRLALERAIKSVTSPIITRASFAIIVRLIACILFIIIINIYISDIFKPREIINNFLLKFHDFSHPLQVMSHETAWLYITSFPEVSNTSIMKDIFYKVFGQQSEGTHYYINAQKPLEEIVYNLSQISLENINLFCRFLYMNIAEGKSILKDFSSFFSQEKIDSIRCYQTPDGELDFFNYQVSFDFFIRSFLTGEMKMTSHNSTSRRQWGSSPEYCSTAFQSTSLCDTFDLLLGFLIDPIYDTLMFNHTKTYSDSMIRDMSYFLLTFSPFIILLILFPNVAFLTSGLDTEKMEFIDLLLSASKKDAEEASHELYRQAGIGGGPSTTTISTHVAKKSKRFSVFDNRQGMIYLNIVVDIILYCALCLLIIGTLISTIVTDDKLSNTIIHFELSLLQRNIIIDMGRDAACLVFVNQMEREGFTTNLTTNEKLRSLSFLDTEMMEEILRNDVERYDNVNELIKKGTEEYKPATGYHHSIDEFFHQKRCDTSLYQPTINYSNCISFDRLISYYTGQVNYILNLYNNHRILDETVIELAYLVESRIANDFNELLTSYYKISTDIINGFHNFYAILFVFQLILSVVISFFEFAMILILKKEFVVYKSLLLRINPLSFVSNQTLLDWIFRSTSSQSSKLSNKISTPAHVIFQHSHDAMILVSLNKVIEFLNPAATTIFGFTPEQMLGQNLKLILPKESNRQLFYIMSLMKCGQTSLTFESSGTGIRDDNRNVPLHLSLIGFNLQTETKKADYFALILKDKTEEVSQKAAIENSKKQTEMILLQILPREIILKLNQTNNKDVSFTVNSATIIFINIDKFSIYASSLPPTDVMKNLSKIFSAIDFSLAKYSLLTKIKLMGDVYFAAAGIFSPGVDPDKHANQVIQFALEVLNAMEALNIQMDANLQVRIGVNTDGPLTAGVLGVEKPLFEVFGDPIIDTERIEKDCIPGCINISEKTYKLIVENSTYHIEPHGELQLKRNGKTLTYLISPDDTDASKFGNIPVGDDEYNNSSLTFSRILTCSSSINIHLNQTKNQQMGNIIADESVSTLHGSKSIAFDD